MNRYAVISEKNPREIVLLRGYGCFWQQCSFCDYHRDACEDPFENLALNTGILNKVTGRFGRLEVINSGSVFELDLATMRQIRKTCQKQAIRTLHFESHYAYKDRIPVLRQEFAACGIELHMKIGVESFDEALRENLLHKGMPAATPAQIAEHFDECCLLIGVPGQTLEGLRRDIDTALQYFDRVCLNLFTACSAPLSPDEAVKQLFLQELYPTLADNPSIDILLNNTDFGVGTVTCHE